MKRVRVVVPWKEGLHLRHAAGLVRLAQQFQSSILFKLEERVADARSILSLITLYATAGTPLDIEVTGTDEAEALTAVVASFAPDPVNITVA